ncbi:MAG: hypothetical protein PVH46_09890 [Granulosicoccaceae bacterium]|jgi:hypothetical protein
MTTEHYHVVFSGKILEYADLNMVKQNVARVFKQPVEKIEPLFSGKPVTLKKNIDAVTAEKYRLAMQRAGALCDIIPASATPEARSPASNAAAATEAGTAAEPPGMSLADVGVTLVEPQPVPEVDIDTADMDMDEVGVTLVEPQPVPEVDIDTADMDMDEVGVTLVEPQPVPEVDIDTADMDMDEVGVTLVEPQPVPEVDIDTADMDMDEVGVTLVEPQPVPEPDIDTSQLKLAD